MKIQTGGECSPDAEHLVPPVGRRRRRVLLGNWQAALSAVTIFVSVISLTMSSIVFMVLLYTPASSPLGQAKNVNDLREISDLQRQMIGRLQREASYLDARQKALQAALESAGLMSDDVKARLAGIERALDHKEGKPVAPVMAKLLSIPAEDEELIGRHDGHEMGGIPLIGRPDGHERGSQLIGRHDGHEMRGGELIGRPDGHERGRFSSEED